MKFDIDEMVLSNCSINILYMRLHLNEFLNWGLAKGG